MRPGGHGSRGAARQRLPAGRCSTGKHLAATRRLPARQDRIEDARLVGLLCQVRRHAGGEHDRQSGAQGVGLPSGKFPVPGRPRAAAGISLASSVMRFSSGTVGVIRAFIGAPLRGADGCSFHRAGMGRNAFRLASGSNRWTIPAKGNSPSRPKGQATLGATRRGVAGSCRRKPIRGICTELPNPEP
jgi:hypothetical protein